MKTPDFWYREQSALSTLLIPCSQIFQLGTWFRRRFARPQPAEKPVLCVGNIVAGGAGKTPTALSLLAMLKNAGSNPVFVTSGYGGRFKGPLRVDLAIHKARDVGDEALLLARFAPTWIGKNRARAIEVAQQHGSHIILDDGLQNPTIIPTVSFLVLDGVQGFGNNRIIPAGPLRETLENTKKRIDAVVIVGEDNHDMAALFDVPVIHAHVGAVMATDFPLNQKFLAFAGIGLPRKFYDTCHQAGLVLSHTEDFPDHYVYKKSDLKRLQKLADKSNLLLLTTEKDWVRLPETWKEKVLYLPITLVFDDAKAIAKLLDIIP